METQSLLKDGLGRMTFCLCMILALLGTARAKAGEEAVELTYVEAEKILPVIQVMFEASAPEGATEKVHLHAIAQTNSIVVNGSDKDRALVKSLVARFDQRPEQIYIDAVIAQVELDQKTPDAWDALRKVTEIDLGGKTIVLEKYQRPGFGRTVLDVTSAEIDKDQRDTFLNSYIEALEKLGNFSVIARPFVFAGNNQIATISSGQEIEVPGDVPGKTLGWREELLNFEITPVINPNKEVTLGIDLKLDSNPGSEAMTQRLKTTLRIAHRDLVVLSVGAAESKDGKRYERLVFLQPRIIDGALADAPLEVEKHTAPKARPIIPRPARVEVEDNFLKREIKYLPMSEALQIVANALERLSGSKSESIPAPDDQIVDAAAILVGETLIISDSLSNSLTVGPSEHVRAIDQLLAEIDVRPRQVLIETSIVEVTLSEKLKFGMDVLKEGTFVRDAIESTGPDGKSEPIIASLRATTGGATIIELKDLSGKAAEGSMKLYVSALAAQSGNLQVITAPRLIATNNLESIISPYKELEIRLNPLINSNDEVTLDIQVKCEFMIGKGNQSTQVLNTKVRLEDGGTIVIGGTVREGDAEGERKELLIFIRPRIISDKRRNR